ncbi:MAG TPA: GNAT family N-acetyltransferase [Microvirga sp.]|jgi:GNAT superfamily N-acetyltransferase|nr:GNAT family N-acetyltransferase [Microvirga sp.]
MRSIALNLNGYTDLPPGKIATVVTYLEMTRRPRLKARPKDPAWRLVRIDRDIPRYRALFRRVGEPWLWFSRLAMPEAQLAAILGHPDVEAYALQDAGGDIGLVELDFRRSGECELQYFGVVPERVGTGAGRHLMDRAIRRAFARPVARFMLHTCSLDHPAALPFYLRSGFVPTKRAIEVADDPRLTGRVPRGAAPQVPVIGDAPPPLRTSARARRPR